MGIRGYRSVDKMNSQLPTRSAPLVAAHLAPNTQQGFYHLNVVLLFPLSDALPYFSSSHVIFPSLLLYFPLSYFPFPTSFLPVAAKLRGWQSRAC